MTKRRDFGKTLVAGGPHADITGKANLEYNLCHGVKRLTATVSKISKDGAWDSDELKRMRDNCDKAGVTLEAIRMDSEYIMLRNGSDRDRRLDSIMGNIQKASQVGVQVITHHWTVIPIRRNTKVERSDVRRVHTRRQLAKSVRMIIGSASRTSSIT